MKYIITLLVFMTCFCGSTIAQSDYKVNQDINYFDGLNWVESQIIKIEKGKYFIYTNREKTKTKWVTADDIEPFIHEYNGITEIKFDIVESTLRSIYKEGDILRININQVWHESELVKIGENDLLQVYSDTTKSSLIWVNEKDVVLLSSASEIKYTTIDKTVTYVYKLDEIVEYFDGTNWLKGKIEKFNDSYDVFINNVWYKNDKIRKVKN